MQKKLQKREMRENDNELPTMTKQLEWWGNMVPV
jgi:hypothetical protein